MQIEITWGQDTPAYAKQVMEVPSGASNEDIIAMAKAKADDVDNLVFEPSWDWTGLRIVSITQSVNGKRRCIVGDIPIELACEDLGLVTRGALSGAYPLSQITAEMHRQGVTPKADVEAALHFAEKAFGLDGKMTPSLVIPDFKPFQLVLGAFDCSEYGDGPSFAEIEMTPDLVRKIVRTGGIAHAAGIRVAHVNDDDSIWHDPDESLRMRGTDLVIMPDESAGGVEFFYQGHQKHADYNTETRLLSIGKLLQAIAAEKEDDLPDGFARRDGVLFYDGESGDLEHIGEVWCSSSESAALGKAAP